MDKETHHWDDSLRDFVLVYTDSIVYRSYHGMVARKGNVGNVYIPSDGTHKPKPKDKALPKANESSNCLIL